VTLDSKQWNIDALFLEQAKHFAAWHLPFASVAVEKKI